MGKGGDVVLREWRRGVVGEEGGWTYHAKGLWVSFEGHRASNPEQGRPSISVVGSSNYTKRSYGLDLETGVVIVTRDERLMGRLAEERDALGDERFAGRVEMDDFLKVERRVSWRVRVAMWIVGVVGGAL